MEPSLRFRLSQNKTHIKKKKIKTKIHEMEQFIITQPYRFRNLQYFPPHQDGNKAHRRV